MVKTIAHFADIHIHKNPSRHVEYREQFNKVYEKLKEQKPDRIVIVGDLYHDYIDLEGESSVLMGEFLNHLSELTEKVVIVRGNHDLRKKSLKRKDTIDTITTLIDNPKVIYYNKSGFYEDDNVIWVVHNHREDINPWVSIPYTKDESKTYIDLYHNPVQGCMGHNGYLLKNNKYNLSDFKGDYSFLGDIHLRQFFKKKKIAYPSSLIQQDFGELPENHGYLLWNIIDNKVDEINIPNDHNFINFKISRDNNDYDHLEFSHSLLNKKSEIKVQWTDLSANINFENEIKIRDYFKKKYNINGITIIKKPLYSDVSEVEMVNESIDILNPNTQKEIFIEYLGLNGYKEEFIKEVLKIDDIITNRLQITSNSLGVSWSIDEFWFDNFKSYGDGNKINWKNTNGIYQIHGENQQGKTTILDAISYILYGTTSSTLKRQKNGDNRYINKMRDLDYVEGGATISINNEIYTLVRKTERKWNRNKTEIVSCSTTLDYYEGSVLTEEFKLTDEVKDRTQKLIESVIGDFNDFMRLVLTNADNLNDLLSQDRSVFIDSITKDAGYDIFEKKLEEFKTYRKDLIKDDIKINLKECKQLVIDKIEEQKKISDRLTSINNDITKLESSKSNYQNDKEKLILSLDKIDEKFSIFDLDDVNNKINLEKEKIQTRKDQLKKIDEIRIEISLYDSNLLKNKRIEYDNLKDLISENNNTISKYTNSITEIKSSINIINMDIKNIVNNYVRSIEDEIKNNNINLSKLKDNFSTKIIEYSNVLKQDLNDIIYQKDLCQNNINNLIEESKKIELINNELENSKVCSLCGQSLKDVDPLIINEKISNNVSEISKINEKINNIKPTYDNLSKSIDTYKNKLDKLSVKEYDFDDELNKLFINYNNQKNKVSEINIENERKINLIKDNNFPNELQLQLKDSFDQKRINNEKITEIENNKNDLQKTIDQKNEELENYKSEIDRLEKEDIKYQKKKEAINFEDKIKFDIDKCNTNISNYESDIKKYNDELVKIKNNKEINNNIDIIVETITNLEKEIKEKTLDKSKNESSLAVIKNDINRLSVEIDQFEKQKLRDEILDVYMKCVHRDGLPTFLLKKSIHIINQELSNILCNVDFNLYFDDELNLKLVHNIKIEASQNAIESSGMERTFASVALKMALRKINNKSKPNFILLDEIMGKLLNASVEKFIVLLDNIKNQVDKLVIIEHIHPINYDVLIEVIKDDEGISSLKIED